MSTFHDRDTAITRDPAYQQQQQQPPQATMPPPQYQYGYGYEMRPYGSRFGGGRRLGWAETKPFFLTSEFLMTVIGILAVAITASVANDLDSRLATALIAGLIGLYTLSRGIAKSGTRSRGSDPRDELDLGRGDDGH
jgi:hypothetical protein